MANYFCVMWRMCLQKNTSYAKKDTSYAKKIFGIAFYDKIFNIKRGY